MIHLHYAPGGASMTPHMLLEELGVPFELVSVDTEAGEHRGEAYRKLNPNGLIPVLVDGDLVMYETAAICLHLLDSHPGSGLAPQTGTAERAHFYKWLSWLSTTLQQALIVYFYPERWTDTPEATAQVQAHAEAKVLTLLEQIETQLANGGPWLLGEQFSVVDLYAMMLCRWTRNFARRKARDFTHIAPWLQRVLARPAVLRMFAREGLPQPWV